MRARTWVPMATAGVVAAIWSPTGAVIAAIAAGAAAGYIVTSRLIAAAGRRAVHKPAPDSPYVEKARTVNLRLGNRGEDGERTTIWKRAGAAYDYGREYLLGLKPLVSDFIENTKFAAALSVSMNEMFRVVASSDFSAAFSYIRGINLKVVEIKAIGVRFGKKGEKSFSADWGITPSIPVLKDVTLRTQFERGFRYSAVYSQEILLGRLAPEIGMGLGIGEEPSLAVTEVFLRAGLTVLPRKPVSYTFEYNGRIWAPKKEGEEGREPMQKPHAVTVRLNVAA